MQTVPPFGHHVQTKDALFGHHVQTKDPPPHFGHHVQTKDPPPTLVIMCKLRIPPPPHFGHHVQTKGSRFGHRVQSKGSLFGHRVQRVFRSTGNQQPFITVLVNMGAEKSTYHKTATT